MTTQRDRTSAAVFGFSGGRPAAAGMPIAGAMMLGVVLAAAPGCTAPTSRPDERPAVETPETPVPLEEGTHRVTVTPEQAAQLRRRADASIQAAVAILRDDQDPPLIVLGKRTFTAAGCVECHSTDGTRLVGPSMVGAFGALRRTQDGTLLLMDLEYLEQSLADPGAHVLAGYAAEMPSYARRLYPREILGLAIFLQSLADVPVRAPVQERAPEQQATDPAGGASEASAGGGQAAQVDGNRHSSAWGIPRPPWWFDGVERRADGERALCVEALGDDLASARRAAVAKARRVMTQELRLPEDAPIPGEDLIVSIVPLDGAIEAQRYAAFVRITSTP